MFWMHHCFEWKIAITVIFLLSFWLPSVRSDTVLEEVQGLEGKGIYWPKGERYFVNLVDDSSLIKTDFSKIQHDSKALMTSQREILKTVARVFYSHFQDNYDFFVVWTDIGIHGAPAEAYAVITKHCELGLSSLFLKTSKGILPGISYEIDDLYVATHFYNNSRYYIMSDEKPSEDFSRPGRLGELILIEAPLLDIAAEQDHFTYLLLHELAHRWGAYWNYYTPSVSSVPPLDFFFQRGSHWDQPGQESNVRGLLSQGSFLEDIKGGLTPLEYAPVELYLMGLISSHEINNNVYEFQFSASQDPLRLSISNFISPTQNGIRYPSYGSTQTAFKMAVVVVSSRKLDEIQLKGNEDNKADSYNNFIKLFEKRFYNATLQRAKLDAELCLKTKVNYPPYIKKIVINDQTIDPVFFDKPYISKWYFKELSQNEYEKPIIIKVIAEDSESDTVLFSIPAPDSGYHLMNGAQLVKRTNPAILEWAYGGARKPGKYKIAFLAQDSDNLHDLVIVELHLLEPSGNLEPE